MSEAQKTIMETAITGIFTAFVSYWFGILAIFLAIKSVEATIIIKTFIYVICSLLAGFGSLLFGIMTFVMFCFLIYGVFEEIIKG